MKKLGLILMVLIISITGFAYEKDVFEMKRVTCTGLRNKDLIELVIKNIENSANKYWGSTYAVEDDILNNDLNQCRLAILLIEQEEDRLKLGY